MHDDRKTAREVEYEETDDTNRMREEVRAYNHLLSRTFIDVPDQLEPYLERPVKLGPRAGEIVRVAVCTLENQVRRVFNRADWTLSLIHI